MRIAIYGTRMVERPTIHVNLGRARALINAATDTVFAALAETDARIAARVVPVRIQQMDSRLKMLGMTN